MSTPTLLATTLLEAAFEGVSFPVTACHTRGGHGSAKHRAYRRRGVDNEPTGQEPYSGTLSVPLLAGLAPYGDALFPGTYFDLVNKLESNPLGLLTHPTKGVLTAMMDSWDEIASSETTNGVTLEIAWTEHNGSAGLLLANTGAAPTNPAASAQAQASSADAAMESVAPTPPRLPPVYIPVTPVFAAQLAFLDAQARTPGEIASAVGLMLAPVVANLALAVFAPATAHAAVVALEALRASTYAVRGQYLGATGAVRTYTNPRAQPLWQIARELYGDAAQASALLAANTLSDPLFVAPGRVLIVPSLLAA